MSAARDGIEMALYRAVDAALRVVPMSVADRAIAAAARAFFAAGSRNVRLALANLRIAYPESTDRQRLELGRASYVHMALNLLDYIRSSHWSDEEVSARCPLEGIEHVEKALARGRGALLLTLHMGNWEVGVQSIAIGLQRYRPAVLGRPVRNSHLYRLLTRTRTRAGAELIDRQRGAQRALRALREGRPVGVLLDQYSRRPPRLFVPLFGVRCSTSAGMATLALRTGAAVVPCFVLRSGPGRHRGIFLPELEIPQTGDRKRDIEIATTHYNEALEKIIRAYPEQWIWCHRRFRQTPDLSDSPYP